jgi:hypothetical protein
MKIKVVKKDYEEVLKIPRQRHIKPRKPSILFRTLLKLVSYPDLKKTNFKCEKIGMEKLGKKENALYLMNHSSFIDMEIVSSILYPRPFNIVTTNDAFIGKNRLLRWIGCIPTTKFVSDPVLVRDILHAVRKLKSSVVLFPEAGYSIDGTSTTIPETVGKLIKMLGKLKVVLLFAANPCDIESVCDYAGILSQGRLVAFEAFDGLIERLNKTVMALARIKANASVRDELLRKISAIEGVLSVRESGISGLITDFVIECRSKDGISESLSSAVTENRAEVVSLRFTTLGINDIVDAICAKE